MLGSLVLIIRREKLLAEKLGINSLERKNRMLGILLLAVPRKKKLDPGKIVLGFGSSEKN
jgi:hypothetical protein